MTASEIIKIASTVAIAQCICDLLARRFIFSTDTYRRLVTSFERAKTRREKITTSTTTSSASTSTSLKAQEKQNKKIQRAEDDCAEAAADVAKKHTAPQIYTSFLFIILYRVMYTEHQGRVVAILPFVPWKFIRRLSLRGIDFTSLADSDTEAAAAAAKLSVHANQACGFLLIYILCTLSVKFIVNKLVGKAPPQGADGGIATMLEDPKSQRVLRSLGVDTEELKEVRKAL